MGDEHQTRRDPDGMEQEDVAEWNLAIVEALADGVHPMTARELGETSIFHDHRVRRALVAARDALVRERKRESRRAALPKKAGQPWSAGEDAELIERFESGTEFAELSRQHGRTEGAIRSRLTKLGKLLPEH